MADVKISALPASTTPLAGTEILPIVQSSTTRQVSVANLTAGRSVGGTDFIPSGSSAPTNGMFLPAANTLGFSTNSTEQMRITSVGDVGIGTTSPTAVGSSRVLEIGATTGNSAFQFFSVAGSLKAALYANASETSIGSVPAIPLLFKTTDTEKMRLTSAGELLVGTTSAVNSSKFLVTGVSSANSPVIQGSASSGAYLNFFNNAQTTGSIQIGQGFGSGSDNVGILYNNANAAFVFGTNGAERMRIDSSGNLLVGTTSLVSIGLGTFYLDNNSKRCIETKINTTAASDHIAFFSSTGQSGQITVTNTVTAYGTSSDYRLKNTIAPMTGALAKVAQLKPVTYKWKADGSEGQGFIAHELAEVIPDCVTGEKDAVDENGKPKYQGVDTSFLVATLVSAIQEQQALIESLTTRLTALENK